METFKKDLRTAQEHLRRNDPIIGKLVDLYGDCTITPHTDYYQQLVRAIIGQQLSVQAATSIYKRFLEHFDDNVPSPEQIVVTTPEDLRAIGFSFAKINYMKDLAEHIIDGRLDLEHIATLPNDEVIKQLVAVKGIGEWSAHMFMLFSLGRLDILPTGDLGIRKAVRGLYELSELPKPEALLGISLTRGWAPYQSVASWYLWRSLDNK